MEVRRFSAELVGGTLVVAFREEDSARLLGFVPQSEVSETPRLIVSILVKSGSQENACLSSVVVEDFVHAEDAIRPMTLSAQILSTSLDCPLSLPDIDSVNFNNHPLVIPRINLVHIGHQS